MIRRILNFFKWLFRKKAITTAENYGIVPTTATASPIGGKKISFQEARNMPRSARRRLGKINGIKIPGIQDTL